MCGIVGVYDLERTGSHDLPEIALSLLEGNRNRGQEGYGVSVISMSQGIRTFKFSDVYDKSVYQTMHDVADDIIGIIGHARYPTSGGNDTSGSYIQPFDIKEGKNFAFAFNGNIANAENIAHDIEENSSMEFSRPILDTKVLEQMIRSEIQGGEDDITRVLEKINEKIDGACNIVLAGADGSFSLAKDRWGFRPLSFGRIGDMFLFSSESSALFQVGVRDNELEFLNTGEAVVYSPESQRVIRSSMRIRAPKEKSRCFFETVYFADPMTKLWGEPSSNHRFRLGQNLGKRDSNQFSRGDTVVMDIPASSEDCANGFAKTLKLHHVKGALIKDPFFDKRSFIGATKEDRKKILEEKYIFNPEFKKHIQGKKLVIVDDSIVRGTTLEFLVELIQEYYEPSEIHIRIPSPPIIAPCYYAINLKHPSELLARKFFKNPLKPQIEELDELATHLGVHSIRYIDTQGLIDALRVNTKDMCLGCITGDFPTPKGREIFAQQLKEKPEA